MLPLLQSFVAEQGRLPKAMDDRYHGVDLAGWCQKQRTAHKKGTLKPEVQQQLEEVAGWYWEVRRIRRRGLGFEGTGGGVKGESGTSAEG